MNRAIPRVALVLLLLLLLLPFSSAVALPAAAAGPGDLDLTFGTGGKVTTDFGGSEFGLSVAIQSDGRIVVAGDSNYNDFAVARYNADGSLDTSFGTGGKVTTNFGGEDHGWSVAIQSDGRIIVAGHSSYNYFALSRYNADGSLDTTFGTGGKVTTNFGGDDLGLSVAIQSDGRIVVAGRSNAGGTDDIAVARYNADGTLDASFGATGKVSTNFGGNDTGFAVAIQSDGGIVVAGNSFAGGTSDFAVARYNANGTLDTDFGTGGKVTTNFGGYDDGYSVAIQSDGRIVVAGRSNAGGTGDLAVARYNANGSLDATFGTVGKVTTSFGSNDSGRSLAIQSDGKIVVAGVSNVDIIGDFALARYNANGTLDTTFGTGGKVTTNFGGDESGLSVAIQSDGKFVVAGFYVSGGNPDFAVARYLAEEPAPTPTPTPLPPTPTPTPVPGVGWPGLMALAVGLAALVWLAGTLRARAGGAG